MRASTRARGIVPRRRELWHYATVLSRRLSHYAEKRIYGYSQRGSLDVAAESILTERVATGFRAGSHFPGVWPRDLCFAARGVVAAGFADELRAAAEFALGRLDETFYTDFHAKYDAATPAEGVDTFPALVVVLDETDALDAHADRVAELAALHRRKFFDPELGIVTGAGSSWWDSAAHPREAYNTAMLLTAIERLARAGIETPYSGGIERIRSALVNQLWNGRAFDEHRESSAVACDANVVPLYFGLVDDVRAASIATTLDSLATPMGLKMRHRPFTLREVRPVFLLHRDYHYHVWPWNSLLYANGIRRYGFEERADREVECIERRLRPYGNFLEVLSLDGGAYCKRGYASAEDFTVAAALWTEYRG